MTIAAARPEHRRSSKKNSFILRLFPVALVSVSRGAPQPRVAGLPRQAAPTDYNSSARGMSQRARTTRAPRTRRWSTRFWRTKAAGGLRVVGDNPKARRAAPHECGLGRRLRLWRRCLRQVLASRVDSPRPAAPGGQTASRSRCSRRPAQNPAALGRRRNAWTWQRRGPWQARLLGNPRKLNVFTPSRTTLVVFMNCPQITT
jgi:hypothetical protein